MNDTYKLYDIQIWKSKKKDDLWIGSKSYVSFKEIEDKRFDGYSSEKMDSYGRPINEGVIFINSLDNIDDFQNGGTYELDIARDERGVKAIEKGVLTEVKKQVVCVNVGPMRKTKEKNNDFCFINVSIKESDFENAKNQDDIIEGFRQKGFEFQKEPYNGFYQFSAIVFPNAKTLPTISSQAGKTLHMEMFVKSKEGEYKVTRLGRPVFENGPLKVNGMITNIEGEYVEVVMFTTWDEINKGNKNIHHFTSKPFEKLPEPNAEGKDLKLTYKVHVAGELNRDIGDEVSFELSEDNTKQILNPKIEATFGEVSQGEAKEEAKEEPQGEDLPF